ncbi:MAG: cytochrome c family protein [Planctomycetota bacterium]
MKLKVAVLLVAVGGAIGLAFQFGGASAAASGQASFAAAPAVMLAMADKEFEYIGSKKCKMCHSQTHKAWETTAHAKALETLQPGKAKEAKEKFKLDPAKDYSTDKACLGCHTVGFGKKGGYVVPDPADEKAVKAAGELAGVGCEACHGPGGGFDEFKKALKKDKTKKYKFEELAALGATKVEAATCTACHNEKSATYDKAKPFDFGKMSKDEKAIHAHDELKQREG